MADDTILEAAAQGILNVVGDMPGMHGRIKVARIVGGYPNAAGDDSEEFPSYAVDGAGESLNLVGLVDLVDGLIEGGMLAQTLGPRPKLCLTRGGHRALDALESRA